MQKQILGFFALISAITTSILLYSNTADIALIASVASLIFIALHLRFQNQKAATVQEPKPRIKLIDELNDRLNSSKREVQMLQARIEQLVTESKAADSEDAAVLMFLRVLQEKSRILDFALTDISRLPDPQVGAAARVVHQGLRSVLEDSFDIKPIALSHPSAIDGGTKTAGRDSASRLGSDENESATFVAASWRSTAVGAGTGRN
jgi:hypothetical protein